ncbi:MAG: hypothetical protein HY231_23965 [Acidobacteria bacterium]|nr:hypothetical protein [Acidobacteriota bacterium]
MSRVKCFWLEPAGKIQRELRRYRSSDKGNCTDGEYSYHNASVLLDVVADLNPNGVVDADINADQFKGDPRWPLKCERCDYRFTDEDNFQIFTQRIYRRTDTGEEVMLRLAAPGAMYDAHWYGDVAQWRGADGRALIVVLPNGHPWHVDGRASNCTLPDDKIHKCWVREGDPTKPETLTVGKNGVTCSAGAGSIQSGNYHGFLRAGQLEEC